MTPQLHCTHCGQPVTYRPTRRAYMHASATVAACDLDSDHPPVPDWAALGEVRCRRCEGPTRARAGSFEHVERSRDAEHAAEPDLPAFLGPPPVRSDGGG